MTTMPVLISMSEAAHLLRITKNTFYKLFHNGHIPHYRIGNQYFFDAEELLAFFRRNDSLEDVI